MDEGRVLSAALSSGISCRADAGSSIWPAFADPDAGPLVLAVPLLLHGRAVAVMCAQPSTADAASWVAAAFEILARHADPRTTEHYDRARGNLDRHGVHFLTAYVAGV